MEVDRNPTRQVLPRPNDPCRRCEHPYSAHAPEGDCTVELTKTAVPSLDMGGTCSCAAFVFEPAAGPQPEVDDVELLDGPALYAEGLGYVRLARTAKDGRNEYFERYCLERAATYFAGAQAYALGLIVIDNGTGDIDERRWQAALAGEDTLPEEDA